MNSHCIWFHGYLTTFPRLKSVELFRYPNLLTCFMAGSRGVGFVALSESKRFRFVTSATNYLQCSKKVGLAIRRGENRSIDEFTETSMGSVDCGHHSRLLRYLHRSCTSSTINACLQGTEHSQPLYKPMAPHMHAYPCSLHIRQSHCDVPGLCYVSDPRKRWILQLECARCISQRRQMRQYRTVSGGSAAHRTVPSPIGWLCARGVQGPTVPGKSHGDHHY